MWRRSLQNCGVQGFNKQRFIAGCSLGGCISVNAIYREVHLPVDLSIAQHCSDMASNVVNLASSEPVALAHWGVGRAGRALSGRSPVCAHAVSGARFPTRPQLLPQVCLNQPSLIEGLQHPAGLCRFSRPVSHLAAEDAWHVSLIAVSSFTRLCVMHASLAVLLSWVWLMLPESLSM